MESRLQIIRAARRIGPSQQAQGRGVAVDDFDPPQTYRVRPHVPGGALARFLSPVCRELTSLRAEDLPVLSFNRPVLSLHVLPEAKLTLQNRGLIQKAQETQEAAGETNLHGSSPIST